MSTIEVRLPEPLAKRLQQEALPPDEAIIKALEWWLEKRRQEQAEASAANSFGQGADNVP
jgi:Arc/MetJ-type ribon-helix-helix transcriptional regulator